MFNFVRNYQTVFQSGCKILHFIVPAYPQQHLVLSDFCFLSQSSECVVVSRVVLVCLSLRPGGFEHLFVCLCVSVYLLLEDIFKYFVQVLLELFVCYC